MGEHERRSGLAAAGVPLDTAGQGRDEPLAGAALLPQGLKLRDKVYLAVELRGPFVELCGAKCFAGFRQRSGNKSCRLM